MVVVGRQKLIGKLTASQIQKTQLFLGKLANVSLRDEGKQTRFEFINCRRDRDARAIMRSWEVRQRSQDRL